MNLFYVKSGIFNDHGYMEYQNSVKRGCVDEATHWRYSRARDYMGTSGLLAVCREW
jgi:hypothetical protein